MGYRRLLAIALVVAWQAGPQSTPGLGQAYFGPAAVVTTNRVFAKDEETFSESLLGRWSGSHGYEIAFERRSPTMYTVAIRTGRDSSASTRRMRASLYGPLSCAWGLGQAPLAAHVLEVEPDLELLSE
jgi:hypothetical protein